MFADARPRQRQPTDSWHSALRPGGRGRLHHRSCAQPTPETFSSSAIVSGRSG